MRIKRVAQAYASNFRTRSDSVFNINKCNHHQISTKIKSNQLQHDIIKNINNIQSNNLSTSHRILAPLHVHCIASQLAVANATVGRQNGAKLSSSYQIHNRRKGKKQRKQSKQASSPVGASSNEHNQYAPCDNNSLNDYQYIESIGRDKDVIDSLSFDSIYKYPLFGHVCRNSNNNNNTGIPNIKRKHLLFYRKRDSPETLQTGDDILPKQLKNDQEINALINSNLIETFKLQIDIEKRQQEWKKFCGHDMSDETQVLVYHDIAIDDGKQGKHTNIRARIDEIGKVFRDYNFNVNTLRINTLCEDITLLQNTILSCSQYSINNVANKDRPTIPTLVKYDFVSYRRNIRSIANCVIYQASDQLHRDDNATKLCIGVWKQKNSNTIRLEEIKYVDKRERELSFDKNPSLLFGQIFEHAITQNDSNNIIDFEDCISSNEIRSLVNFEFNLNNHKSLNVLIAAEMDAIDRTKTSQSGGEGMHEHQHKCDKLDNNTKNDNTTESEIKDNE